MFNEELKQEVLADIKNGLSVEEASLKYAISRATIYLWMNKNNEKSFNAEITRLKDRIDYLENQLKEYQKQNFELVNTITKLMNK